MQRLQISLTWPFHFPRVPLVVDKAFVSNVDARTGREGMEYGRHRTPKSTPAKMT